jgi:rod shape-determining protein MreC
MEFLSRYKNALVLIAVVLTQAIALAVQVQRPKDAAGPHGPDGRSTTLLRSWTVGLMTPFERLSHGASYHVGHVWSGYVGLRGAHEENAGLKAEVARLRLEQAEFAEDAAEGRRLQSLLAFKGQYIAKTVAAQVIGTSGTENSRVLYIDKGTADGLKPDDAVMTPDGVVGKLREVFAHTAQLVLLSDATSGAGVVLESTRIRAVLRGTTNGRVEITNLLADSRIKPGENVVTSGGDMVFPRGLPVGVIESIAPDPQHQPYMAIMVKTDANLARLEEVLVITGRSATLPPAAQADAEAADATAAQKAADITEANKRAADLVADKLPSATEDAGAPDENVRGGVPGVPNSGLPKIVPAVHADRYSPGASPAAADMKPGGSATH